MPDSQTQAAPDLSTEIRASLCTIWARYVGARPASSELALEGGVVRWTLPDGTGEFERGMAAVDSAREPGEPVRTLAGYERELASAVTKATGRRVKAKMSKHDKKTGIATETFILEMAPKKY
jgi:hypothetical protein